MDTARTSLAAALAVFIGIATLAGCAPTVLHASGDGITFSLAGGEPSPEVARVAQAHCDRFGKRTRFGGSDSNFRLSFQCVE